MYRCAACGHHHIPEKGLIVCQGVTYDDEGGISRCHCHHTSYHEQDQAA